MFSIGLDISADFFTASCIHHSFATIFFGQNFSQNEEGWIAFLTFLETKQLGDDFIIIMENTGVYSERISYFLYEKGLPVFVEPPHFVRKAFYEEGKTDPVDSAQIAEYGFRFGDRLHPWQPPNEIVEQIKILLTTREHLSRMKTACKNTRKSLIRKQRHYEGIQAMYAKLVSGFDAQIEEIEKDIEAIIKTNPILQQKTQDVLSITNTGFILTTYLLVTTEGFTRYVKYTSLAKYIGICPLPYQSGSSVKRKTKSKGAGPKQLRKNLYLAALRLRKNHPEFKAYFERKVAEGKEKRLVINNIENRLLRLICGVLNSNKPYIKNYRSSKPF